MAKVIQIRRGTTKQNDNFTGMPGEITFDTDAKILRVHDGVRLGGYPLARADDDTHITVDSNFDINSVSDDFWEALFARFAPTTTTPPVTPTPVGTTFTIKNGNQLPVRSVGSVEYVFDSSTPIIFARIALTCLSAEAGYSAGEVLWDFGINERSTPIPNTWLANDGAHAYLAIGSGAKWWVAHRTTGARTEITNGNWSMAFTVWC